MNTSKELHRATSATLDEVDKALAQARTQRSQALTAQVLRDWAVHLDSIPAPEAARRAREQANGLCPAAACPVCGGWTSVGGCSQHANSSTPIAGRTGCTCHTAYIVRGETYGGDAFYYTGRTGQGWIGTKAEAFTYGTRESAQRKADQFNSMKPIHCLQFTAVPAA